MFTSLTASDDFVFKVLTKRSIKIIPTLIDMKDGKIEEVIENTDVFLNPGKLLNKDEKDIKNFSSVFGHYDTLLNNIFGGAIVKKREEIFKNKGTNNIDPFYEIPVTKNNDKQMTIYNGYINTNESVQEIENQFCRFFEKVAETNIRYRTISTPIFSYNAYKGINDDKIIIIKKFIEQLILACVSNFVDIECLSGERDTKKNKIEININFLWNSKFETNIKMSEIFNETVDAYKNVFKENIDSNPGNFYRVKHTTKSSQTYGKVHKKKSHKKLKKRRSRSRK